MIITLNIEAPELVQAINNLAVALSGNNLGITNLQSAAAQETNASLPVVPTQQPMQTPYPQQPVQPTACQPQGPQLVPPPMPTVPAAIVPNAAPAAPAAPAGTPPVVPTAPQSYSLEQLAVAATQLVDAGRRNELVGLLGQFGVQALTALPKEQFGAFATALRAMGAKL